jgi:hypothetical protein
MLVKCHFCNSTTNKVEKTQAVRIDDKNFHPACAQEYLDKKELSALICKIFKLKAPGPRNYAFMTKFYQDGMSFRGMINSLIYFYEVKKNSKTKANESIGIIPYIYEDAQKYFYCKEKNDKMRLEAAEKNSNYEIKQIIINNSKEKEEEIPSYLKPIEFVDAFETQELEE